MTNRDIEALFTGLNSIQNQNWPARVAFAIVRNIKTLAPLIEDIQNVRMKIVTTYGVPMDGQPDTYQIPPEKQEEAMRELDSLYDTSVDVNIVKIKLKDIEQNYISVEDMEALYLMIDEENGEG